MDFDDCISKTYTTVCSYAGINAVEDQLSESSYLVVADEAGLFCGILTPDDIIKHPHKLVIDSLTPKEVILMDDDIASVLTKFHKSHTEALPVFQGDDFIGIVEKKCLLNKLTTKIEQLYSDTHLSKEARNAFLHNLSHEIRTPLNQILGFMNVIIDFSPEELALKSDQYYSIIKNSSDQFLTTMNDLIELSLLHSGEKMMLCNETFNLETLFSELKSHFEAIFRGIEPETILNYSNPDSSLIICSDRGKIKQVFLHLIDSAIRHASGMKIIHIGYELSQDNSTIRFFVRNLNARIDDNQKAIIVEAFNDETSARKYDLGHLGFGVDLVKRIVEVLDGTISLLFDEKHIMTASFTIPLHKVVNDTDM